MVVWLRCLCLVALRVGGMYCDYWGGWFGRFGLVASIGWLVGLVLVVCLCLAGGFLCLLVRVVLFRGCLEYLIVFSGLVDCCLYVCCGVGLYVWIRLFCDGGSMICV